ncbi:MAG: DUF438 domain-containing protein [Terracidiphilus sp.]
MSELLTSHTRQIATLKHIIRHLHEGRAPEQVRAELREIVKSVDASEIMAMEQELMNDGISVDEVRSMCDLHSQVTRDLLVQIQPQFGITPGHPADTFREENKALQKVIGETQALIETPVLQQEDLMRLRQHLHELLDVEKHFRRKEGALFSCLERHEITGPSKVMWAKDDEALQMLAEAVRLADAPGLCLPLPSALRETIGSALAALDEMIYKEEQILLPLALRTLSERDWGEIWISSPQFGWCLVDPRKGYMPPADPAFASQAEPPRKGRIQLPAGSVSTEQLIAIFSVLPLDLTFVDAEDRVAFFTEGPHRVFARGKAVIGRAVQHCHPPASVGVVQKILDDFRSAARDLAEFWIDFRGRFIHIRYFAVRDEKGEYLGALELTQDLTPLRALEGERRLLQYD